MPDTRTITLHFREFFNGQRVRVLVDGKAVLDFKPRTRTQVGLASVETISVGDTSKVVVRVDGAGEKALTIVNGVTVYLIGLNDKTVTVEPARDEPTYM